MTNTKVRVKYKGMNNVDWKSALLQAVTDIAELCRGLKLPPEIAEAGKIAAQEYPLFVPKPFLNRIEKGNPTDPVLLQILPQQAETVSVSGFSADPVGESSVYSLGEPECPVVQKYAGRSLLLTTNRCGIHCRFCFRRHRKARELTEQVLSANLGNVSEVILSGGDPLMLDDAELKQVLHYIKKFSGVKRLRFHSRLPVVLPKRLTPELAEILRSAHPAYLVLHINHPNELSEEFFERIALLKDVVLMSQTVLLKGVNDDDAVLTQLFETLVEHRIVPYYLHQLDKVSGAAHFEVSIERGRQLMSAVQEQLSGYAVPAYVQEIAGQPYKRRL